MSKEDLSDLKRRYRKQVDADMATRNADIARQKEGEANLKREKELEKRNEAAERERVGRAKQQEPNVENGILREINSINRKVFEGKGKITGWKNYSADEKVNASDYLGDGYYGNEREYHRKYKGREMYYSIGTYTNHRIVIITKAEQDTRFEKEKEPVGLFSFRPLRRSLLGEDFRPVYGPKVHTIMEEMCIHVNDASFLLGTGKPEDDIQRVIGILKNDFNKKFSR